MGKVFSGIVVPMITPLNQDYTIDVGSVEILIQLFAKNSIHPLVLGTTGESTSINEKESLRLVTAAMAAKGKNQHIYVGLVGNQVHDLIKRGNAYFNLGVDCVVATLPSYYSLSALQMKGFYQMLADNITGPLMIYNIKSTTHMSIPLEVIDQMSKHSNIWGLKDSERDENRMKWCIQRYKDNPHFSFFCGWGAKSYQSLQLGADGIVPSTGNYVPEMYKSMYEAAQSAHWEACKYWQSETDDIAVQYQKDRTLGQSLAMLKFLMSQKKLCQKTMMPPLTEI